MKPSSFMASMAIAIASTAHLVAAPLGKDGEQSSSGQPGDLAVVQTATADSLRSVTSVEVSRDGRFLYAASFNSDSVSTFRRDPATGQLEFLGSITNPDLDCAVSFHLSADGKYGSAASFRAESLTLFKRDAESGLLTVLDSISQGRNGAAGLDFAIESVFSPDNRFVYSGGADGVGVFKVENDKLSFVQLDDADGRLKGLRAVVLSPSGDRLYAAGASSGTVGVFQVDKEDGKLTTLQVLANGDDGIAGLKGAFRIACSRDGRHVYVSSGRFGGDQAVSAFAVGPQGSLTLIEEYHGGSGVLEDFQGGNSLAVSPDGELVYVLASVSDRLFRFQRDAERGALISIGSQEVGEKISPGSAGLCFSPDGKFVYVADENSNSIVVLKVP